MGVLRLRRFTSSTLQCKIAWRYDQSTIYHQIILSLSPPLFFFFSCLFLFIGGVVCMFVQVCFLTCIMTWLVINGEVPIRVLQHKCDSEGAIIQKFAENGWFWPFFLLTGGGSGGQSLRLGGICPHAPLDAATVYTALIHWLAYERLNCHWTRSTPHAPCMPSTRSVCEVQGSNYTYTGYRGHCLPLLGLGLDAFWPLSIFWAFFITSWPCSHVVTLPSNENPSSSPGALMPKAYE